MGCVLARMCLSRARYEDTGQTISRPLQGERLRGAEPARWVVRKGGLEPPRLAAPAPKAGASTSSATFAISARQRRSAHLTRRVRERRKKLVRAPVGRRALSAGSRFSLGKLGSASCRERVCQYGELTVV